MTSPEPSDPQVPPPSEREQKALSKLATRINGFVSKDKDRPVDYWRAKNRDRLMVEVLDALNLRDSDEPFKILDFGCGTGHLVKVLESRGLTNFKVFGVDLSAEAVKAAKHDHPQHEWVVGGVEAFNDMVFDFALAFGPACYYQGVGLHDGLSKILNALSESSSKVGLYLLYTDIEVEPKSNNVFVRFNDEVFASRYPEYRIISNMDEVKAGYGKAFDDADIYAAVRGI